MSLTFTSHQCSYYCRGDIHALEVAAMAEVSAGQMRCYVEREDPDEDGHYATLLSFRRAPEVSEAFYERLQTGLPTEQAQRLFPYAYIVLAKLRTTYAPLSGDIQEGSATAHGPHDPC